MTDEWRSLTHRFAVGGHHGYIIVATDDIETRSAPDPSEPMEAQGVRRAGRVVRAGREGRAG